MADMSGADLDRMLSDARKALESMRKNGGTPAAGTAGTDQAGLGRARPAGTDRIEGVGEAADGRLSVTAETGGRIARIRIDPRAMRMASEELAEQLTSAVNAALDDLRAKTAAAGAGQAVDVAALGEQVERIQNDGMRQMALISQAITETLSRIGGGR